MNLLSKLSFPLPVWQFLEQSQITEDLTEPHGLIKTSEDTKCEPY